MIRPEKISKRFKIFSTIAALILLFSLCFPGQVKAQGNDPVVELQTTKGKIYIRVFRGLVPRTSMNFLDLVSRGFYNGTVFHRIESWCVQGGSPNGNPHANFIDPQTGRARFIPLEINRSLAHSSAGVVAMARTSNPNSASCQFYILKKPMRQLDGQYAIFGRVLQGINAVQSMRRGDRIISARIIQSNHRTSGGNSSGGRRSTTKPRGPVQQFKPPTDIPDSGF